MSRIITARFEVDAREHSRARPALNTRISVSPDQTLILRVDPGQQWQVGGGQDADATGIGDPDNAGVGYASDTTNHTYSAGSLVCIIGASVLYLPVGRYAEMTALDGNVSLAFWEWSPENNSGSMKLTMQVIPRSTSVAELDGKLVEVGVYANAVTGGAGKDAGVRVKKGQTLMITCDESERWAIGGNLTNHWCTANGRGNPNGDSLAPYALAHHVFLHGTLVGSLDEGKTFFPVGTRLVMTALQTGNLRLYCWTDQRNNSEGSLRVRVKVGDSIGTSKDVQITHVQAKSKMLGDADEYVELTNKSTGSVDISRWVITGGDRDYTFPPDTALAPCQKIRVYTDLIKWEYGGFCMGSGQEVWDNRGGTAELKDADDDDVHRLAYTKVK